MSGDVEELPPYKIGVHLQAAFGGAFGTLNLLVGAVSIFRQIIRAFEVGLSPILKNVFAAYVQVFHGLVDFLADALTWVLGVDLSVPVWAHDWIILWFVGAGAVNRLHNAIVHAMWVGEKSSWTTPRGFFFSFLMSIRAHVGGRFIKSKIVRRIRWALVILATFLSCAVLWPLGLLEIILLEPAYRQSSLAGATDAFRMSFPAIFLLQALAIALAVFGLSVLNAQTM